jgi:hypothetical protein
MAAAAAAVPVITCTPFAFCTADVTVGHKLVQAIRAGFLHRVPSQSTTIQIILKPLY